MKFQRCAQDGDASLGNYSDHVSNMDEATPRGHKLCHLNSYDIPKRALLADRLRQFSQASSRIAILLGARSSGKTTILRALHKKIDGSAFSESASRDKLKTVFFNIFLTDSSEPSLNQTVDPMHSEPNIKLEHSFWIVDDANDLSWEQLNSLLEVFSKQECNLKLVLAGDSSLLNKIENFYEKKSSNFFEIFRVEPLSYRETKRYIKKNLCHFKNDYQQIKKQIKKIYSLSEGQPGRINRILVQLASEEIKMNLPKSIKKERTFVDVLLTMGILFLLGVVGLRLFLAISEDQMLNTVSLNNSVTKSKPVGNARHSVPKSMPASGWSDDSATSFIASIENLPEEAQVLSEVPDLPFPEESLTSNKW